ncbi:hypothetical protein C2E21_3574 [Chlorella sorokiniana]|uniref:Uncharacterized protein n=1 Tax=Chlorella sorokiniana TaxID=3076 RepID=A0A2P6TVF1_CHLSO|nr:hypothetical protein C2E21_3574 [Chlorella sorokiniana]|eukprot:PRW58045.1 hypothetical protein C2E21_3574 [Chlorella sorokiniana]
MAALTLAAPTARLAGGRAASQCRPLRRSAVAVRAAATPEPEGGAAGPLQAFARRAEQVLERYDFVSAGLGAMAVTGFCVMRGQDVGTALWITAASAVVAILVNDMLPEEH